jgi:hypothetical protein
MSFNSNRFFRITTLCHLRHSLIQDAILATRTFSNSFGKAADPLRMVAMKTCGAFKYNNAEDRWRLAWNRPCANHNCSSERIRYEVAEPAKGMNYRVQHHHT